jgi:hypothetical protein
MHQCLLDPLKKNKDSIEKVCVNFRFPIKSSMKNFLENMCIGFNPTNQTTTIVKSTRICYHRWYLCMHHASLDCMTMQFLALEMKRVRVLYVLTARNLRLFQYMHGRATRLWRQVTWSGYVVWLFCSDAWCMHGWESPPRLTFQTSLLHTPSKRSSLLHLVIVMFWRDFLVWSACNYVFFPPYIPTDYIACVYK